MFIPPTIDLGESEKYVLSIRIKPTGFMFSISDPKVRKNYCLRETSFLHEDSLFENIKRIVFDLNFLTQQFLETNVIFVSCDYDIVPNEYYQDKQKKSLYSFVNKEKDKHIASSDNAKYDNTTLFAVESEIYEFLSRSLFNPRFYHHTNLLMNFFGKKTKAVGHDQNRMFINFHDDIMDVICFSGSRFVHCLSFENEPTENQIYYILQLWTKLGLDQQEDQLLVFGQAERQLMATLQDYIKDITNKHTPSEVFLWHEDAQKAPLDLLSLSL